MNTTGKYCWNVKDIGWVYEDWIQLAPDMDKCWTPANPVMSLWVA
jgi:hypothetical protein